MSWSIEFFEDAAGRQPAREFLLALEPSKRAALIAAIEEVLEPRGLGVCATEYGRPLGKGLFEFRVRHDETVIRGKSRDGEEPTGNRRGDVLLRLFCHAYGDKIILLLAGYDKGEDPSPRRQTREIEQARKRLRSFQLERQRKSTRGKRRG
jgi:phage-related protein